MNSWFQRLALNLGFLYKVFQKLNQQRRTLIIIGVLVFFIIGYQVFSILIPAHASETIVTIKSGETATQIGEYLAEKGIIRSAFWFKVLARITHSDRYLKPGKFVFGGYTNLFQTLEKIRSGKSLTLTITIPEGLSTYKTFQILARSGIATFAEFEKLNSDSIFIRTQTGQSYTSLEGFLYPETYKFSSTVTADSVLAEMVEEFKHKTESIFAESTLQSSQSMYQTLILASIVENEAVVQNEKPLIASVYLNRLQKSMKLESCPTVGYLLEKQGIHREYLLYKDLEIPSPYNTYINPGLPPTPICSPTDSSIKAILNPARTSYLFFFADRKGNNIFSNSYAEHLQKQKQFKQLQRIRN